MPNIITPRETARYAPDTDYVELVFTRPTHAGTGTYYGVSGKRKEFFGDIYSYRKALENQGWSHVGGDQNADGGVFYLKFAR